MKSSLRLFIAAIGVAAALPVFAADAKSDEANKEPKARKEMRVITTTDGERGPGPRLMGRPMGPAEMESVTFLGIETSPVTPTLVAQLSLSQGSGLVVSHVSPKSPADGMLKQHDILLKLDDQILIEQRQLAVLVRNHKEGDEVTLTYLRGGKQATAKVKLAKHDAPKMSMMPGPGMPGMGGPAIGGQAQVFRHAGPTENFDVHTLPPDVLHNREDVNRVLSLIDGAQQPGQRRMEIRRGSGPGDRNVVVTVNTGKSRIISEDDQGSLELSLNEGRKELVAKNQKGEQVFAGPVNTPEERKALPAELRERLEKLENMKQFSFKTDGDFQGSETKIIRPRGQGISLPAQPPRTPPRSAPAF